ncbi:DHA2 family efflux MFS transporter permease subunit [Cryptosporangium sp. NPDC048952]|uniref:DHA2 family efflux MFS transporter permease subunit n=1 Tax=Cryptosporangium sp. NPDC048952 TaxID=3363961 RepID=UPI00371AB420
MNEPIPWPIWRVSAIIASCAFLTGLDASVVNVGLDTITRDLHTTLGTAQWVATGYLVAFAASLPICGWLGRRIGVGRLWLACAAAFTIASAACAFAPTIGWLIGLRVVQGLAAGMLIPAGQTVIGQAVGPARLGRVMAALGVAVTLAPALGPVVGGAVIEVWSWPWLFLINVPVGVVAIWLGLRYLPRGEAGDPGRLDAFGLVLLSVGLPLVVYGCTRFGESRDAGPLVLVGAGVGALVVYGVHSARSANPILDLRLFGNRAYRAAVATGAFAGAALFGAGLLYPLYFQLGRGADPLETGLLLLSMSLGTTIALPLAGRLSDRIGGGWVSLAGSLVTVASTFPFALLPIDAPEWIVQGLLFVRGAGLAGALTPAVTAAFAAVTPTQLPDAAAQVNIVNRVGGALGGAIFAVVVANGLPRGADVAFHSAFWWLVAASALGVLAAAWLTTAEARTHETAATGERI